MSVAAQVFRPLVLDSSCWLEYLRDTPLAHEFAPAIEAPQHLVVPLISVYEVYKKLLRELGAGTAIQAVGLMRQGLLVEADLAIHLSAAAKGLPMADSLIYATALAHNAQLWTLDAHFEGMPSVRMFTRAAV